MSARTIRPALAPDSVSQISFIFACSCLKPFVHPVLIGRWTTASPSARGSAIRTSRNSHRHPAGDAQWGISSLPSVRQCQLEVAKTRLKGSRGSKTQAVETGLALALGRPTIRKGPFGFQRRLRLIVGGSAWSRRHPWVRGGPPQNGCRGGPSAQRYGSALRFARCDRQSVESQCLPAESESCRRGEPSQHRRKRSARGEMRCDR